MVSGKACFHSGCLIFEVRRGYPLEGKLFSEKKKHLLIKKFRVSSNGQNLEGWSLGMGVYY